MTTRLLAPHGARPGRSGTSRRRGRSHDHRHYRTWPSGHSRRRAPL
jgi:hypothetical protein